MEFSLRAETEAATHEERNASSARGCLLMPSEWN